MRLRVVRFRERVRGTEEGCGVGGWGDRGDGDMTGSHPKCWQREMSSKTILAFQGGVI